MSQSKELTNAYRAISTQPTVSDAVDRWMELECIVQETTPDVDVLQAMSMRDEDAEAAVRSARAMTVGRSILQLPGVEASVPYYRGSGMMMVARGDGILAASYELDHEGNDALLESFGGPYQHYALLKVGRAALLAKVLGKPGDCMETLERIMRDRGLIAPAGPPHHFGYDFDVPDLGRTNIPGKPGDYFVGAGATGFLPTGEVREAVNSMYAEILLEDRQRGWVTGPDAAFDGFHDVLAANQVTSSLTGQQPYPYDIRDLAARGANLH